MSRPSRDRGRLSALSASCALALLVVPAAAAGEPAVVLRVRDSYLPDVPILVRIEVVEDGRPLRLRWDDTATLSTDSETVSLDETEIGLRNGEGSALVLVSGSGPFTLTASVAGATASRELVDLQDAPVQEVSGDLPGTETEWSGVVHLTGDVLVPAGHSLRVLPGTLVLLDGVSSGSDGVDLDVEGALEVLGVEGSPVTFTALDPARPWGEIDFDGGVGTLRHAVLTRGGSSPGSGHTGTGSTLRADGSSLVLEDCSVTDLRGKTMTADASALEFWRCHFARSVMGPEIDDSSVLLDWCHISEMRGADDNDGIYLHSQQAGQEILLRDTVIAGGDDDGVDTLRSDVVLESCIIRDWGDKGVSVYDGDVALVRAIVASCAIGVSNKGESSGGSIARLDRCSLVANVLGLEARDKFGNPEENIEFEVTSSIVHGGETLQTGFAESKMRIRYSALDDTWPGEGNFTDDPMLVAMDPPDYRLQPGSPCVDTGDPDAELDPDGSRADRGALPASSEPPGPRFTRGSTNGDGTLDISDAVTVLFHLFGGRPTGCLDAADANDDGGVDVSDVLYVLEHLFRLGPPPPAPATCGEDPTPDELDCEEPSCDV